MLDTTYVRGRNKQKTLLFLSHLTFNQLLRCKGDTLVTWLIQREDEHNRTYCTVQRIFDLLSVMLKLLKGKLLVYTRFASSSFLGCCECENGNVGRFNQSAAAAATGQQGALLPV